jgi:hypothetical protein
MQSELGEWIGTRGRRIASREMTRRRLSLLLFPREDSLDLGVVWFPVCSARIPLVLLDDVWNGRITTGDVPILCTLLLVSERLVPDVDIVFRHSLPHLTVLRT